METVIEIMNERGLPLVRVKAVDKAASIRLMDMTGELSFPEWRELVERVECAISSLVNL